MVKQNTENGPFHCPFFFLIEHLTVERSFERTERLILQFIRTA